MAATKGKAVALAPEAFAPTEKQGQQAFSDIAILALPSQLFRLLSDEAAKRQLSLAQLLSLAVTDYLKKTEASAAGEKVT